MADFGNRMMDFLLERDSGDEPTGDLFRQALDAMPDEDREVRRFFEAWVWVRWCERNLPSEECADDETACRSI